jgi:hypothetical protein
LLAQACLELLHPSRRVGIGAQHRTLGFGNDPYAVFAADPLHRLTVLARFERLQRGAHGLQLDDLGVVDLSGEQCDAILAEEQDGRGDRDRDDDQQHQREPG